MPRAQRPPAVHQIRRHKPQGSWRTITISQKTPEKNLEKKKVVQILHLVETFLPALKLLHKWLQSY